MWAHKFLQVWFLSFISGAVTVTTALRLFVGDYFGYGWPTWVRKIMGVILHLYIHTHPGKCGAVHRKLRQQYWSTPYLDKKFTFYWTIRPVCRALHAHGHYQYLTSMGFPESWLDPRSHIDFSSLGNDSSLYNFWSLALKLFTDVAEMVYSSKLF